jgi:hypothetical protein
MRLAVVVVIFVVLAVAGFVASTQLHSGQARCSCVAVQFFPSAPPSGAPYAGSAGPEAGRTGGV